MISSSRPCVHILLFEKQPVFSVFGPPALSISFTLQYLVFRISSDLLLTATGCNARFETFRMFLTFPPDFEFRLRFRNRFLNPVDINSTYKNTQAVAFCPQALFQNSQTLTPITDLRFLALKGRCFEISFEVGMCSQEKQTNVLFVLSSEHLSFEKMLTNAHAIML